MHPWRKFDSPEQAGKKSRELDSTRKTQLLDVAALVNSIARNGPGTSLTVRIRSKSTNSIVGIGKTKWRDDRWPGGPAVVFDDEDGESLISLGGEVVFDAPPKITSFSSSRKTGTPFGEVRAHQADIDPIAEGYSFEIVKE